MKRFVIALALSGCGSSIDEPVQPPPPRAPAPRASVRAPPRPPPARTASRTPPPSASRSSVQVDCRPGARNISCTADGDCERLTLACRGIAGALAALPFGADAIPLDVKATCIDGACEMRE